MNNHHSPAANKKSLYLGHENTLAVALLTVPDMREQKSRKWQSCKFQTRLPLFLVIQASFNYNAQDPPKAANAYQYKAPIPKLSPNCLAISTQFP